MSRDRDGVMCEVEYTDNWRESERERERERKWRLV